MQSLFKVVTEEDKKSNSILNLDFFTNKENTKGISSTGAVTTEPVTTGKKRGRPKKDPNLNEMVKADENAAQGELPFHQTNEPYKNSYNETNDMIKASIYQIDTLNSTMVEEITNIKNSKTLKGKYNYLSQLAGVSSSLLGTKLGAIKEMNKVITDSHNLELKRIKDLKLNTNDKVDDDKYIMDMYNAFINTPVGTYGGNGLNAPSMVDMTMMNGVNNMVRVEMGTQNGTGFDAYLNNLTPVQNMMMLEKDPNVKTVVVYDAMTGNRWFEVMNTATGETLTNVDKPDAMFLEDTTLDTRNGIARNVNLDTTYPLIVINGNNMMEY